MSEGNVRLLKKSHTVVAASAPVHSSGTQQPILRTIMLTGLKSLITANKPIVMHTAVGICEMLSSQSQGQLHLGVSLSSAARPAAFASTATNGPDEVESPSAFTRSVAIAVSLPTEPNIVICKV
ncbi:hypothetical protein SDC9_167866 [bioreactor metagenome]|uniref:Uncharacterized protein n=1 Tax=bioreactor metagenome TaxID=1076179 RepID=A0A645G0X2_9ZZZZ